MKDLNQFQRILNIHPIIGKSKGKSLMINLKNILKGKLTITLRMKKIAMKIQMKMYH
jgi:hypothetical protein